MNQMDMKKFVMFFAVLLMGLAVVACTDDGGGNSDYGEALIGTWQVDKGEYYELGKLEESVDAGNYEAYIIFTESGQVILREEGYSETMRYELKGKKLTFYDTDDFTSGEIKKLTRKELVLSVVEDSEDDSYTVFYCTRVD